MTEKISVTVGLDKYKAETIRYAAYAVSGAAYVLLEPGKKGQVVVTLEPRRDGAGMRDAGLKKRFLSELKDEKLRSALADANRELREFMVLKGLSPAPAAPPRGDDSGLTSAQEKELDELIAQVEREIKSEGKEVRDPLGIAKTWEEKYDSKAVGGKSKKSR